MISNPNFLLFLLVLKIPFPCHIFPKISKYRSRPPANTKTDLKYATETVTSKLATKYDLGSLKTEVNKLDIDKLILVPADLSKLSDIVKNYFVKKTVYDKLVAKINNIDTDFFKKLSMTQINQI